MTEVKTKKRDSHLESLLHSEHTVNVEKLLVGGDGLARLQIADQSIVVFIPDSAPQDQVLVQITEVQKNFLKALIKKIIVPSPFRRLPPCQYAVECGGCNWQHVIESEQINQKELILKDLIHKFLPNVPYTLLNTIKSEQSFGYRNRIQLKQKNQELGYFKKRSHDLVNINDCLIAEDPIRQQINALKANLKPTTILKKFELRINQNNAVEHYEIGEHGEGLSFSQVNNFVNSQLVESIVQHIQTLASTDPEMLITELYAGAGNFTFSLVEKIPKIKIEAVELNSTLTKFAIEKIKRLKLNKNITFFTTQCETFSNHFHLSKKLILLDPPRSGCHPDVIERIAENSPENILYISCHPSFLVRDLDRLIKRNPSYKIKHLQIFDMFPQTDHFETVCLLSKS
jgi:23S rRNA (uracil1939-C5)-methyltransferase